MTLTVISAVLLAALLHASWNFLIKRNDDKLLGISAMVFGHVPFSCLVLLFVPGPDLSVWPYILGSFHYRGASLVALFVV